jgi:D-inositol-3-phosphate glycosyltransferase
MCRIAMLSVHTCPLATLGGKETGGMNVYVRELSRELGRQGKQIDIFTRAQDPTIAPVRHLAPNVRVIHIPTGPVAPMDKNVIVDYLDEFVANVEAFRRAEEIQYDLVHAHYWLSGLAGRQLADQWGVPLLAMFHTLGKLKNQVAKSEAERDTDRRIVLEGDVMQWADMLVAATPVERAQMTWLYGAPRERITVIPCGVDGRLFYPRNQHDAHERLDLPCGRLLLFVGRIERLKGLDTLLEAAAQLVAEGGHDDLRVLIVGGDIESNRADNPELRRVQALTRTLGIADRVDFLGSQPQAELPYFYAAADVTVMPSHYESFGMVALESMACGTPVIASRVGGLASLVRDGETGYLVPAEEPAELADRIRTLLADDDLCLRLGAQAADHARQYRWPRITAQVIDLYHTLIQDVAQRACACPASG